MVQFGRFLETAKSEYTGDDPYSSRKQKSKRDSTLESVIAGEYFRLKDEDFIRTDWGSVSLQNSSSGQQESLPLLLALSEYPRRMTPNDLIIIEEPEAHLFPVAQKRILELIVQTVLKKSVKVLITTHSPYILACLNNEIYRNLKSDLSGRFSVSCYQIADGQATSIFDAEDNLIDLSALDSVSETIAREFAEASDE